MTKTLTPTLSYRMSQIDIQGRVEFELVEAEANKIGYSFIDNEKSNI